MIEDDDNNIEDVVKDNIEHVILGKTNEPPAYMAQRKQLRIVTRGIYDIQKLRMQMGLRIVANFKAKLGQAPGQKEEDLKKEAKEVLDRLRESYTRLTDKVARNRLLPDKKKFVGDELISDYIELVLINNYIQLERTEAQQFRALEGLLTDFRIWNEFLTGVTGCGPAMGAVIMSEIPIHNTPNVGKLWALCGLDVAEDGFGRSRRKEHLVERTYTNRQGKEATRLSITFNPFLKTKLAGVLGPSFLRTGSSYAKLYYDYKNRIQTDPGRIKATDELWKRLSNGETVKVNGQYYQGEPFRILWTPQRIHDASIRYMVKIFLQDMWKEWRRIEGLSVTPTWAEKYLGHTHGQYDNPPGMVA